MKLAEFDFDLPPDRIAQHPARPRDAARLLHVGDDARRPHGRGPAGAAAAGRCAGRQRHAGDPGAARGAPRGGADRADAGPAACRRHLARAGAQCPAAAGRRRADLRRDDKLGGVTAREEGGGRCGSTGGGSPALRAGRGAGACRPISSARRARRRTMQPTTRPCSPRADGAVAAPTAGLHFTPALLAALEAAGIPRVTVTLHVGAGTFLPVRSDDVARHRMHAERGEITADAAERSTRARRVVAVGTTTLRLLESAADERRPRAAVRGRDAPVHPARLPLPAGRRAADQLPPAAVDLVHAGLRLRRHRPDAGRLRPRDRGAATASTPTATRACWSAREVRLDRAAQRRRRPRRACSRRARRGRDAGVHAGRHRRHGEGDDGRRRCARPAPRSCSATPTT